MVSEDADVILAGQRAKAVLTELAFDEPAIEELVLVVHELASNIVKHADVGSITLRPTSDEERSGIEIRARDSGPGITNIDQAVIDGYSTAGSLGGGLGSIRRIMDDVVINSDSDPEVGVEIVATRWSSPSTSNQQSPPLAVGVATRAKPGHDQNGDAFLIEHGTGQTLVGVIDGLGHGQAAHHASSKAEQYVRVHSTQPLADLFAGVEQVCRDTRGVVMLLARFDWATAEVTLGSVGNISLRVCHSPNPLHLVTKRGVLGASAPNPVITEWDWDPASVMVVHSDGLTSNWNCDELALHDTNAVPDTANNVLRSLSTRDDDATVLIIREADQ